MLGSTGSERLTSLPPSGADDAQVEGMTQALAQRRSRRGRSALVKAAGLEEAHGPFAIGRAPCVPPRTISCYQAGEHATDTVSGDVVLLAHASDAAASIRLRRADRGLARRGLPPRRRTAAPPHRCVRSCAGTPGATAPRSPSRGTRSPSRPPGAARGSAVVPLSSYVTKRYCVVHFELEPVQRAGVASLARSCSTIAYGWASIAGSSSTSRPACGCRSRGAVA